MGLDKKIKKFFKKLGKQIKTNLKHGAKYIAPVLISAMTGGFGSGIVKSLFGNRAAGSLANFGNGTIGRLFGGRAALPNAEKVAEGAEAVGEAASGIGIPSIASSLGAGTGIGGIASIAEGALSPALTSSASAGALANGANLAKTLAGSNAIAKTLDKGMETVLKKAATDGLTGGYLKTYGTMPSNTSAVSGGERATSLGNLDVMKHLPRNIGDDAKAVEVDPNNIADTAAVSPISREDELREALRIQLQQKDENERFPTDRWNNFNSFNRGWR